MRPPVFILSGPPASGKTTLAALLLARFERAVHLPVDDLRGWVVRGMADSVPWTDETERQFRIAEAAALELARRYRDEGFAVALDHCRNPARLDEALAEADLDAIRVLLAPSLDENLRRNHARTGKSFPPSLLDGTIRFTNAKYREDAGDAWLVIDNTAQTPAQTVATILELETINVASVQD